MNKTIKWLVVIVIILAVAGGITAFMLKPKAKIPDPIRINTKGQPMMGNPKAKLHIVAFEDLKCSNCKRYNNTLFPTIKKEYIDTGKANYTMVNLAFIPGSINAANAARCVYMQNKTLFFPYVKYIYQHQPPEEENWTTIPKLVQFASNIKGINTQQLSQCIFKSPYTSFIRNNLKMAEKIMKDGVVMTPTLYINGRIVRPLSIQRFNTIANAVG